MGKLVSFLTIAGKTTAIVRRIQQLDFPSPPHRRVQLTDTTLVVSTQELVRKALVLRRSDYELLEYTRASVEERERAMAIGGEGKFPEIATEEGVYCASEEWEAREEWADICYAKRYHSHLFAPPAEDGQNDGNDSAGSGDEWGNGIAMSQDY
jgi:hypothetical protein